jgi:hypothetical protein
VAQQWAEGAHQAQQATLEAWQAGVGTGDKLLSSASSEDKEDKGRQG